MKLVIFDIDGTILDSVKADDDCFIQTFQKLYQIDLSNADWNDFRNVTDLGLTIEIFEKWLNRMPTAQEIAAIKAYFYELLSRRTAEFIEIENACSFIKLLSNAVDFEIGFATGGWKETAELKCSAIGLNLNAYILKSSNDHFNRAKIIEYVISEALNKNAIHQFDSITYFGDGLWDFKTTTKLGIDFIGIDYHRNNKLLNNGVQKVIPSFVKEADIISWIKK